MKNNIDIVIFTKTESGDNNLNRIIANDINEFKDNLKNVSDYKYVTEWIFEVIHLDERLNKGDIASILDEELGEEI